MKSWMISVVAILGVGVVGCDNLMVEDRDDIEQLAAAIDAKTDADKNFLTNAKQNKRATEWAKMDPDEEIGEYECPGGYTNKIKRRDVMETINQAQWYGYRLDEILKNIAPMSDCKVTWYPGAKESLDEYLEEAREDADESTDSAYWLPTLDGDYMREHPQMMTIIGVVAVGGVLVALPVLGVGRFLCPLSDAILCPDDPGAPSVPQTGPADGGDR